MLKRFFRHLKGKLKKRNYEDINPEDIFLDSANLPGYDEYALEGRLEKPVGETTFLLVRMVIVVLIFSLAAKLLMLQGWQGSIYAEISENNRLEHTTIFANRGIIYDRNLLELATNAVKENENSFAARVYTPIEGLAHVVGYLKYPSKDSKGVYYDENYHGRDGVERIYEERLAGQNGIKLTETDVKGSITSESVMKQPIDGRPLVLSLDVRVTEVLHKSIASLARTSDFVGGAGIIMNVLSGEVLALTSFPEYDSNLLTSGGDNEAIGSLLESDRKPFLNRVIGGLYAPGSIVKPLIALGALNEGIISPEKEIFSSGSIVVPNPYDPDKPSIFLDWKAHGWTAMKEAIAVSSDTYFYAVGGGYGDQKGLGIENIDKYLRLFGFEEETGIALLGEVNGVVPTPEWKKEKFDGDIWRLGDTYITSIGQYGTQLTPMEAVRFVAAIANGGKILRPTILAGKYTEEKETDSVERIIDL
ncbi:MAG: penicillin-binding transpeptidase domain-containing protein, partial [Patescibacteria group bacterium]